jgi:hypothetical protein
MIGLIDDSSGEARGAAMMKMTSHYYLVTHHE